MIRMKDFFLTFNLVSNKAYILYKAKKGQHFALYNMYSDGLYRMCSGHNCHLLNCANLRMFKDTVQSEDYYLVFDLLFQNSHAQEIENVEPVEDESDGDPENYDHQHP